MIEIVNYPQDEIEAPIKYSYLEQIIELNQLLIQKRITKRRYVSARKLINKGHEVLYLIDYRTDKVIKIEKVKANPYTYDVRILRNV
jgi:hypothetical protein